MTAAASTTTSTTAAAAAGGNKGIQLLSVDERVAAHTHVTGLGLDPSTGEVDPRVSCGLIGQVDAREACGLVVDLVRSSKLAGRALLLVGPPGTGKTAIAVAISKSLGSGGSGGSGGAAKSSSSCPFTPVVASQVYSKEVKKTEILAEQFRKAIGLRIREQKEVYEGEVTELTAQETEDPLGGTGTAGYGRSVSHVILGLKTTKGTKQLKLDPTMYDALSKEQVTVGDVIYIEANSGAVKRLGRSDTYATEFDLEAEEYVPLPKGDVHKKRQVVQDVTLHDLDVANAQPSAGSNRKDVVSMLAAMGKPRKTELTDKLRQEVNSVVQKYVNEGVAELVPGVLFIDEVHMLDLECFTFLHRSLESPLAPIVVLASNRGVTKIHNSDDVVAPHGIPVDLLDRLLIVPTYPYEEREMVDILRIRSKTERIDVSETALQMLGSVAVRTSLRYAAQLLTPAKVLAETFGRTVVEPQDVESADDLFLDGKASAQMLQEMGAEYGYMT